MHTSRTVLSLKRVGQKVENKCRMRCGRRRAGGEGTGGEGTGGEGTGGEGTGGEGTGGEGTGGEGGEEKETHKGEQICK